MDPNANLEEQRRLATNILRDLAFGAKVVTLVEAERLAELVIALDEWLTKGGFLPAEWAQNRARV